MRLHQLRLLYAVAWLLCSGSLVAEVIFERTVPPEVLEAHEVITTNHFFEPVTDEQLQELIEEAKRGAAAEETILKMEILYDKEQNGRPYFRNTSLGRNLKSERKSLEWFKEASRRFAISEAIGETVPVGLGDLLSADGGLMRSGYIFLEGVEELGHFTQRFKGPEGQLISVEFCDSGDRVIDHHQFLRSRVRDDCRVVRRSFGYAVQSRDRWGMSSEGGKGQGVSWLHGKSLMVEVLALGKVPNELVDVVGRKFLSSLPHDFKIDKTVWGREEMRYYLSRMRQALDSGDKGERKVQQSYAFFVDQINQYFFIPPLRGVPRIEGATLDQKKGQLDKLEEWWRKNENKTEWHEEIQQLVAKGQSPEDLQVAAKQAEERKRRESLDAPLTDEFIERVKEKLIAQFEREMKESLEQTKASGISGSFEKTDEGWMFSRRDLGESRFVYKGPEVRRRLFSKERPLEAMFTRTQFKGGKESETSQRKYEYEKLTDSWRRKS